MMHADIVKNNHARSANFYDLSEGKDDIDREYCVFCLFQMLN